MDVFAILDSNQTLFIYKFQVNTPELITSIDLKNYHTMSSLPPNAIRWATFDKSSILAFSKNCLIKISLDPSLKCKCYYFEDILDVKFFTNSKILLTVLTENNIINIIDLDKVEEKIQFTNIMGQYKLRSKTNQIYCCKIKETSPNEMEHLIAVSNESINIISVLSGKFIIFKEKYELKFPTNEEVISFFDINYYFLYVLTIGKQLLTVYELKDTINVFHILISNQRREQFQI